MNFSGIFIKRPVLAMVVSILIILFGVIGFSFLGIREYPNVDSPIVTVSTSYPGANAEIIESQITEPLEESINGIAGIRSLTSSSRDGSSYISVEFEVGTDMEAAANDVRDRVSRATRQLPPDVDPPRVVKSDADASPIFNMTLQSDRRNLLQLSEIANNLFKERLQTTPGVSEIRIWGEKRYSIKISVDPLKLAGYGMTPADIRDALNRENIELPSGRVEGYGTELSVRTVGRLTTEEEFNNLIIKEFNGTLIKLKDIGRAELLPENEKTVMRGNGKVPMVGIAVTPQPGANHIAIVDEIKNRIELIKKEMPDDLIIGVAMDTTQTIRKGIKEVEETILIAFSLVVLIIFLFLRQWRTTIIPVLAIPISLIGSFFIMYLAGFTINILTLLSIVLATGLVVDDAIVVLENIYSKIEKGMTPMEAGFKGSKEIIFAIISTTITLAAVFLPIIFLQGLTGQLFREFGVVMAGAVLISAFVSLTLTPMLAANILKSSTQHGRFYRATEPFFVWLTSGYDRLLGKFLKNRWLSILVMVISLAIVGVLWPLIPGELAPMEDKSRLMINVTGPEGASFEKMDEFMNHLVNLSDTIPEKESMMALTSPGFGSSGSNSGFLRITLVPPSERERSQQEIADYLTSNLTNFNFARAFVTQEQTIGRGRGGGLPVQVVIQAPNLEKLRDAVPKLMARAQADPSFQVVDINLKFNKPEMALTIDRERARTLGLTLRDIAETLQLFFSGQRMGFFIMNGKQYQVICQADRQFRDEPIDLSTIYIRNREGDLIQLDNVVNIEYRVNLPQLYRYNRYISATISASPAPGYTLSQGIEAMQNVADEVLDDTFTTSLTGVSRDYAESSNTLLFAFLLALILIYLILAAQFESFRDPLVIMFTVPLAAAGALLSLLIFGQTLNIFSQIGMIMLIGIVTKNGILIVEFANQKKYAGIDKLEAVRSAAAQRFRPILMTSLATVLGALPIALALGAGTKSRTSMGIVIIGGLLFALVLTLFVIPAIYTFISGTKKKFSKQDS
ncbi:MAG: efflux RND transporter permease subunit [Bacteroidales bacterium]|jgi:multidrug efflux pump|nr:efflux RND transporter permease subunit [Bacteroidales bacterium]MDD2570808.1 efflux RND transporter permease subunit [Bacteroidales bacterium]MDD3385910.1 efflux RND transporter permease subunit [Bacteroidales bacterium]MDD3811077.1 efflux RND transporter permease subunit [Bacteroidales bacterium]MDD3871549.1 efflux RND transporter permease subunit [Bacteroidales bacterium]